MTFRGHIEKGMVRFDEPVDLPDGTRVEVHPARKNGKSRATRTSTSAKQRLSANGKPRAKRKPAKKAPTLYEALKPIIGKATDLPRDAARNFKHYMYGHPKK